MSTKIKIALGAVVALVIVSVLAFAARNGTFMLLDPKGIVAEKEKSLILMALAIMFAVAIPTLIFLFITIWKYREKGENNNKNYAPLRVGSRRAEAAMWALPCLLILILGIMNWRTSHELDPYKPLEAAGQTETIQVVSLPWKWLFIYPKEHIATVNFVEFPEKTSVEFELTSDAPMNSFWIPQLGGQIYSMAGMSTQLHLMADEAGDYNGRASDISGMGFAGMVFIARAATSQDFAAWVDSMKEKPQVLDMAEYEQLAKPSTYNPPAYYGSTTPGLYTMIMMKFMSPASDTDMAGMEM